MYICTHVHSKYRVSYVKGGGDLPPGPPRRVYMYSSLHAACLPPPPNKKILYEILKYNRDYHNIAHTTHTYTHTHIHTHTHTHTHTHVHAHTHTHTHR